MPKVLKRHETLYDQDLLAWAEQQATHLREGRIEALDTVNMIEELEALSGSLRRELKSRLRTLLLYLLKRQFQSRRRSRNWVATIAEQRDQIEDLLEEGPSLRRELKAMALAVWPQARKRAAIETGLPRETFPADLPYDASQILGENGEALT